MPNVGKPSKGCKNCRERKIKCYQERPSCSQCIRAGRDCYGYRDTLSMMFKNENDLVAQKAKKRYEELANRRGSATSSKSRHQGATDQDTSGSWITVDENYVRKARHSKAQIVPIAQYLMPESMPLELMPSIEEQAQGFFFANYVALPLIVPRGQFEWVPELLAQPRVEEVFRTSVNAVSLAGLANSTKSLDIMQRARTAYVSAIRMINNALMAKQTAVQDSTLVAVIMLGLYENMVYSDKTSVETWAKHVSGACALLVLRGKDQFKRGIARHIFHQFYGSALLAALEMNTTVHEGISELYRSLVPSTSYDVHGRAWTTRLVDVIHQAIDLNQDHTSDPIHMIKAAVQIDRDISAIKSFMPPIWRYKRFQLLQHQPHSHHHYGRIYHIYADPWIAQMWNNLRSCRMYMYKLVRRNISRGRFEYDPPLFSTDQARPQRDAAEKILRATVAGIVASVPQIAGMLPFPRITQDQIIRDSTQHKQSNPYQTPSTHSSDHILRPPGTFLDPARSTGLMHLIWPLYAAATFDFVTFDMRAWVIDMLGFIARRIGSRQAIVLAEELKELQRERGRDSGGAGEEGQAWEKGDELISDCDTVV